MGAGAVGGYYGACLQRGGHEVTFVARGRQLDALSEGGLRVDGAMGRNVLPEVEATDDAAGVGGVDLILLCVKTYDLVDAARAVAPCDGIVLTLQNGVEAAGRAREVLSDRVLAGTTGIVADLTEPGRIEVVSAYAWVRFGEPDGGGLTDRVRTVADWLDVDGVDAIAEEDVRVALWQKMALMCGMAGLTTLHQRPMGEILGDPGLRQTFERLVAECERVARAAGVDLPGDFISDRLAYASRIDPGAMSSMSRDFARGRRVELDTFNGAVVRMGAELGIDVPANTAVEAGIREAIS